jgi:hypothetical protein
MAAPTRGAPRRHPQDLTGRVDEQLKLENADAIERAAEEVALANPAPRRRKRREVIDYTDDARPKVAVAPPVVDPTLPPKKYVVRLVASIENMTYGKEIIDEGEWDATLHGYTRPPVTGALKRYDFIEGQPYKVDEGLYVHLKGLGYLYEDDEEED